MNTIKVFALFFDNKTHYILNLCANLNQKINMGLHTQITSTQCNVQFKQILSCGVNICEHTVALDVLIFANSTIMSIFALEALLCENKKFQ